MRLIIHKTIIVLVLLLCLYATDRSGSFLLDKVVLSSNIRFSKLYNGDIDTDILVLGSSRGVSLYTPDIQEKTGLRAFNLSYNGMSMVIARDIFCDFLQHNNHPSILALEISNLHINDDLVNNLKIYKDRSRRISNLLKLMNYKVFIATNISNLYKFNSEYFLRSLYYLGKQDQTWANRYTINMDFVEKIRHKDRNSYGFADIRKESLSALNDILELASKHHIEVRLLVSPYLPFIVKDNREYIAWKYQVEKNTSGSGIWDYSSRVSDLSYFADDKHLNIKGSKYLTTLMITDGFFKKI